MTAPEPKKPARKAELVVLHQGAIGDFILTLSVVQAARAHVEAGHVTVIATAAAASLAAGRSAVDAHRSPDQVGLHTLFRQDGPLDDRLASVLAAADWVLSFLGDASGDLHRRLCEATGGRVASIDPRPSEGTLAQRRHITAQWRAALRSAGLAIPEAQTPVIRGRAERQPAHAAQRRRRIVIHPGSGGRAKCWPMDRFVELAKSLADVDITWMLGPVECEVDKEATLLIRDRVTAGRESLLIEHDLTRAAQRIADADLYVGNDAGMTHVAAALGVPTLAIFGPTDPAVWRPLGSHVSVAAPARRGDPITAVGVEPVKGAVQQVLSADY